VITPSRFAVLAFGLAVLAVPASAQNAGMPMHHDMGGTDPMAWRMPPMDMTMPMLPGLDFTNPGPHAFLPGMDIDPMSLPMAAYRKVMDLADGDTLELVAGLVRRTINDRTFVMYGFNGQYPGPLIRTAQNATVVVRFRNETSLPNTVHWHGVRLDNRFDGVPGVTQDLVQPGDSFTYRIRFPDAGIYWYHPHHREDITQDLGLYGNMMVNSPDPDYYNPVNDEEIVMLDDLLIDDAGLFPYGREHATHTLMGRFGNVMLLNGEPQLRRRVRSGDVVRYFFTNVSNTRVFNLSFEGARVKVIGSDVGKYEHEAFVDNIVIAPAERYIVEVLFDQPGAVTLTNRVQAINHFLGSFYPSVDTLGVIQVSDTATAESHRAAFEILRVNHDVIEDIDRFRSYFDRPVDHEIEFGVDIGALPLTILQMMTVDTFYYHPMEWNDAMPMMNYMSTSSGVTWYLKDVATGRKNTDIDWHFKTGDVVKLRLVNKPGTLHPMHHPIHIHGQRFLVLGRDGVRNTDFVWKDTAVIPLGSTVDLLVDMSNPGDWMMHCHISEHLETGMKLVFHVDPG